MGHVYAVPCPAAAWVCARSKPLLTGVSTSGGLPRPPEVSLTKWRPAGCKILQSTRTRRSPRHHQLLTANTAREHPDRLDARAPPRPRSPRWSPRPSRAPAARLLQRRQHKTPSDSGLGSAHPVGLLARSFSARAKVSAGLHLRLAADESAACPPKRGHFGSSTGSGGGSTPWCRSGKPLMSPTHV